MTIVGEMFESKIFELENKIDVLQATIKRLKEKRPPKPEGDTDYIIKETDHFTIGVTHKADDTWSSVWYQPKD